MSTSSLKAVFPDAVAVPSGPQATDIQYKLSQSYRIATGVNAGTDVEAIANASSQIELFTVGSDGMVWNFYPDSASGTN